MNSWSYLPFFNRSVRSKCRYRMTTKRLRNPAPTDAKRYFTGARFRRLSARRKVRAYEPDHSDALSAS